MLRLPGLRRPVPRRVGSSVENPLTFTQGLTRTGDTVTNDLITGKAGGQTINGGVAAGEGLTIAANVAGTGGVIQLQMATVQLTCGNQSINSAAGAQLDACAVSAGQITIIGGTPITDARGFNQIRLDAPQIVSGVNIGPGGTVPAGATVKINGVPAISGGGAFAGSTGAVALWVHGSSYFDATAVFAGGPPAIVGGTGVAQNLTLQSTTNAQRGGIVCNDPLGVGRVPGILGTTPQFAVAGNTTITSAANATVDYVVVNSPTVTITGGTPITTATGCNFVSIEAPAYVSAVNIGAGGNTPAAATLVIKGPPTISGGGAFLGFGATTLWVQGNTQIDGQLTIGTGFQLRAVTGAVTIGPGGLDLNSLSATLRMGGNVGLGGGAAATLGTVGGAGPATAAQNGWLPITVAGTVSWFPFWR